MFKRRAEIELNYSRDLEKLSKLLTSRHKEQKLKVGSLHSLPVLITPNNNKREEQKLGGGNVRRMRIIFSVLTNNAGVRMGKNLHI